MEKYEPRYLPVLARARATREQLCRLELEIHNIEMLIVKSGGNDSITLGTPETAREAIDKLKSMMQTVEAEYQDILSATEDKEETNE